MGETGPAQPENETLLGEGASMILPNMQRELITFSIPDNVDLNPGEVACGLNTITSLARRCLDAGVGTVNHGLLWIIIKLIKRFELEIASARVSHV